MKLGPYEFHELIGKGGFSEVFRVTNTETGETFACKRLMKSRINDKQSHREYFEREVRIMQQIDCPEIVNIYDLIQDEDYFYLVIEYCPDGDLLHYIKQMRAVPERLAKIIMIQILTALDYLHKRKIAHRDIKPENIFFTDSETVKVGDLGLSRFFIDSSLSNNACGSPSYASPESLSGKAFDPFKSDLWSLGVTLYSMISGRLPWRKVPTRKELIDTIVSGNYTLPIIASRECRDVIAGLMEYDVSKRWTIRDVLNSEWMKSMDGINLFELGQGEHKRYSLSLKKIDKIFGKEIRFEHVQAPIRYCVSYGEDDFPKAVKQLKTTLQPAVEHNSNLPPFARAIRRPLPAVVVINRSSYKKKYTKAPRSLVIGTRRSAMSSYLY